MNVKEQQFKLFFSYHVFNKFFLYKVCDKNLAGVAFTQVF